MPETINNTPAILHVRCQQGDAWRLRVTATGMDLTGYSFEAAIHPHGGGDDVELEVVETDLDDGIFEIKLTAAQSAALESEWHTWCLIVTPPGTPATPRTWLNGNFIIEVCQ